MLLWGGRGGGLQDCVTDLRSLIKTGKKKTNKKKMGTLNNTRA